MMSGVMPWKTPKWISPNLFTPDVGGQTLKNKPVVISCSFHHFGPFTYFTTEDHVLLSVLNSARSFLSVAGGELVTDLRDPHRPDANLDELVGVGVQGHHHLVHDTSLRVSEICISSLVITHFFLFLLWKKNFLFLKYVQEGEGDVENTFINPSTIY